MSQSHHESEAHGSDQFGSRLNWLRAGVLGAEDGIVSTAGILIGVAAASSSNAALMTAGVAALSAGAVSMALGEYVSVSTQRDTERGLIAKEKWELENLPDEEHAELVEILADLGISQDTAEKAATELEEHNLLKTHLQLELGIDEEELTNPWTAAFASALSFLCGGIFPLIAALLVSGSARIPAIILATIFTLVVAGTISAKLSDTVHKSRSVFRLAIGGVIALAVTYAIGWLFGTSVG